ncbi:serine/threonine-protein phosphatase 2A 56 kDa regulatory subunit alpha isoform-like [Adelges cooleyi]|uniref:serine/threonine-protein phosphatase 2A 56 kDa regulatory subunit alpha isoform-like n=1 Tax=Adelges cooleyi TaxID=133065 RepID=UPI002180717B|nr:serine/threonine-protein phosphatase 2A 56 kDa regulatory subunit alpha isoform-like [Adelges cooleyi]
MIDDVMDYNAVALQLLKKCTQFKSSNVCRRDEKTNSLEALHLLWTSNLVNEVEYSAAVYESLVSMFASNVFRPLPSVAYSELTEEHKAEIVSEYEHIRLVYRAFQAFLKLDRFRQRKAQPHFDRKFVDGLVCRLNSILTAERINARDTIGYLYDDCPFLRPHIFQSAISELTDFTCSSSYQHNGIVLVLDVLRDTVIYTPISDTALDEFAKILLRLVNHDTLIMFDEKLLDCLAVLDRNGDDLVPQMLVAVLRLWQQDNDKAFMYLRMVESLYGLCDSEQWSSLQPRVLRLVANILESVDSELSDKAMSFWNRIFIDKYHLNDNSAKPRSTLYVSQDDDHDDDDDERQ